MFRPPKELQKDPLTVETATIDRFMNFVDRVGPPVSADWLNMVDRAIYDLEQRVSTLEARSGQTAQVVSAPISSPNPAAGRGPPVGSGKE